MAVTDSPRSSRPLFTVAAWLSLLVPLLAAAWFYIDATTNQRQGPERDQPPVVLAILLAIFALSFVVGWVSMFGIPTNGALTILPPALLGIVASFLLALLAAFFLTISGLPPN